MFSIPQKYIKRVSFITKSFPRVNSSLGLTTNKLKSTDRYDGSVFCGGRSSNRDLLTLFGLISDSQKGASTFAQLPLLRRSIRKLTDLVEKELETIGAHEVLLPTLIPQKLWHQSKRLERQENALKNVYCFKDNSNNEILLGPTYEESITQLISNLNPPYLHELPLLFYQTSDKFRYEPNPRFGLIRSNQFLMNDLYSFDASLSKAEKTYELVTNVYSNIFASLNLECLRFESAPGEIGGKYSHEYQLPVSSGEDHVIQCNSCSHAYNYEMVKVEDPDRCLRCKSTDITNMQTLELAHTFLLSDTYSKPLKAQIKVDNGLKVDYQMGCFGLGLSRILGAGLDHFSLISTEINTEERNFIQMRWPSQVEPYKLGIVGPARRSNQHTCGSDECIERMVLDFLCSTSCVDILIEDREKEGIFRRLAKLQSLGIPNIIVVGERFLQEQPQFEVLTLSSNKKSYQKHWMTENQVLDFVKRLDTN